MKAAKGKVVTGTPSKVRIDRFLSNQGISTRRHAPSYLRRNVVTFENRRIKDIATVVNPKAVTINGNAVEHASMLHVAVHKPIGYVCSRIREGQTRENKIIYDLFPDIWTKRNPILSVAGRLDKWASGLVILSQSGSLVHRLISPKFKAPRIYDIKTKLPFSGQEKEAFGSGDLQLKADWKALKPAGFEITNSAQNICRLTLHEGRYHQIRRMLGAVGNQAVAIHRIAVGPISLDKLPVGKWRLLTNAEVASIMGLPMEPGAETDEEATEREPEDAEEISDDILQSFEAQVEEELKREKERKAPTTPQQSS